MGVEQGSSSDRFAARKVTLGRRELTVLSPRLPQEPRFGEPKLTLPTPLSHRQITDYCICPGCFFQRKKERQKSPESEAMVLGRVMHDLANLVWRINKKTEIRFTNLGALKAYVDKAYLLQLKGEYPEWVSQDKPYRAIRKQDIELAKAIGRYPQVLEDESLWQNLAYYIDVARNSSQMLAARELEFSFPVDEGNKRILIAGRTDQVRRIIRERTPRGRKFGDWIICEHKTRIDLRPENNLPYGSLALQLAIEGRGFQEHIKLRKKAMTVKAPRKIETMDRIKAVQQPLARPYEDDHIFLEEIEPQTILEADLLTVRPPVPRLLAYDFSTADYWELTSFDNSLFEKALLAVAMGMTRFRGYNQNHKHTFPPPVTKPYLPGLEPNREFYNAAMEALNKFRDSCVWTQIKTGAADRVLMGQLARSV